MKRECFALEDDPLPLAPAASNREEMDRIRGEPAALAGHDERADDATGRVTLEKDEPVCMVFPIPADAESSFEPALRTLDHDPALRDQTYAWKERRDDFMRRFAQSDPATLAEAWQKDSFLGKLPGGSDAPAGHTNKLRPAAPVDRRESR